MKYIENIAQQLIDIGVEIDTHQDGDAFVRTFTFNDAQLEALLDQELQKAREEERKRIANLVVEHSYTNDYGDYMGDSDKILQAIHSELDQDVSK